MPSESNRRSVRSLEQAKSQLASASAPVQAHYDVKQKIKLAADVSAYGLGAVISHVYEDGNGRPIAYALHTLSNSEKNYHIVNTLVVIKFDE